MEFRKTAVLVPCYKRPEYTAMCLRAIREAQKYRNTTFFLTDDGSNDETAEIIQNSEVNSVVRVRKESLGLRNTIIEFFEEVLKDDYTHIAKIDNDCVVPDNWLSDLTAIMEEAGADIISPNVSETNAALKYGFLNQREGRFIPSRIVGGLWYMKRSMIEGIYFEKIRTVGIRAAFHLINQIVVEKNPKIGWTDAVTYDDIGHWHGSHPSHIKSLEHYRYSQDIGRRIAWRPEGGGSSHANLPS